MYKVITNQLVNREYEIDPKMPFEVAQIELDSMVRKAAAGDASALKLGDHTPTETVNSEAIVEVWRGKDRIYPRAKRVKPAKPVAVPEPKVA